MLLRMRSVFLLEFSECDGREFPGHFFIARIARSCPKLAHQPNSSRRRWNFLPRFVLAQSFFIIIVVDALFTTLLGPPFTNPFDGYVQTSARSCVWHAC